MGEEPQTSWCRQAAHAACMTGGVVALLCTAWLGPIAVTGIAQSIADESSRKQDLDISGAIGIVATGLALVTLTVTLLCFWGARRLRRPRAVTDAPTLPTAVVRPRGDHHGGR
jgi:hypothetical protein